MPGSLIKVDEFTVSSAVASVIIGGGSNGSSGLNASIDTSFDVYILRILNFMPSTDNVSAYMRITKSGTADTTSNYDYAYKDLKAYTTYANNTSTNQDKLNFGNTGTSTNEGVNTTMYLFNFGSSSEYSFGTEETSMLISNQSLRGQQGGFVHTVASASDGVQFFFSSGNIASGTFTLYGLKK